MAGGIGTDPPLPPRRGPGRLGRWGQRASFIVFTGVFALVGAGHLAGYRMFVVRSGSMGATAPTGCVVLTHPTRAAEVVAGDVILMRRGGSLPVLHRVVERVERDGRAAVRTKGDANSSPDPDLYVLPDDIPTLDVAVPRLGYAVAAMRTPAGWLGLVVFPTLLITLDWLRRYWGIGLGKRAATRRISP